MRPWYAKALSQVWLLVGEDEIRYASAAAVEVGPAAAIITDQIVVIAYRLEGDEDAVHVSAHRRSALKSISIRNSGSLTAGMGFSNWPGPLAIALTLDDTSIELPLAPADVDNHGTLLELTTRLIAQLKDTP